MSKSVIFFLVIGSLFALTHLFATLTSLYWFYPWFDTVMHFWGGLLIVLGVRALQRLGFVRSVNKRTVFGIALVLIFGWEIFEYSIGLVNEATYFFDTLKDIVIGSIGVIIGYLILRSK